jgi:predicted transcriptional regulator
MVRVDPRLISKLGTTLKSNSTLSNEKIRVVVTLNLEQKSKDLVNQILHDVELATNQTPENIRFYEKLGLILLEAPPQYIQKLTENSNVSSIALAKDDDLYSIK